MIHAQSYRPLPQSDTTLVYNNNKRRFLRLKENIQNDGLKKAINDFRKWSI